MSGANTTCAHCGLTVAPADVVETFDHKFCSECANHVCGVCGTYFEDTENLSVVAGVLRCRECTWCFFGDLCCGCGTELSGPDEMVVANDTHQFCMDCKDDLNDHVQVEDPNKDSEREAPF